MKKLILIATVIIVVFTGCIKTEAPGGTTAKALANEWWITVTANGNDILGGHVALSTYNSAPDQDSIWIDDGGNFWNFKCKARADYKALTFSTTDAQNDYYDSKVTLSNGKILPNAGHSKTGNITDSIYVEAKFNDDPDNLTYIIAGTARTFRAEDDY
ncbi:MAG: hypothetical protein JST75_01870 [Bacteroidetes bacterium]|nr:hypothetical protein [Bacteroidota bacterium]